MRVIVRILIGAIIFIIGSATSYALSCDGRATLGEWKEGVFDKENVHDIADRFDTQARRDFVKRFSDLPVEIDENTIIKRIGRNPTLWHTFIPDHHQLNWVFNDGILDLSASVSMYKGCVYRIIIFDFEGWKSFSRFNVFPRGGK